MLPFEAIERRGGHSRALESAVTPRFLTLVTLWQIRLTLYLLLTARKARLRQTFSGLSCLGDPPIGIDRDSLNNFGTV